MPYTLSKGLLWFLLALLLGVVVGWLLRSIRATRQLRAARQARHDAAELERLRARIAELEPLLGERSRSEGDTLPAGDLPEDAIDTGAEAAIDARVPADAPGSDHDAPELPGTPIDTSHVPTGEPVEPIAAFADPDDTTPADPDLDAAAAVLGRRVARDDLEVVDGVGPAIAELLRRIGITTWNELGHTEVSLLRTMLSDAGPQFATHQPDTWPEQARLLAAGQWAEFRAFVDRLDGGAPVE